MSTLRSKIMQDLHKFIVAKEQLKQLRDSINDTADKLAQENCYFRPGDIIVAKQTGARYLVSRIVCAQSVDNLTKLDAQSLLFTPKVYAHRENSEKTAFNKSETAINQDALQNFDLVK